MLKRVLHVKIRTRNLQIRLEKDLRPRQLELPVHD